MRYYRLWIYVCNAVIFLSAISFAAVISHTIIFASDRRRYLVPGLPHAFDPTSIYVYFALIIQFGVVQLLGYIAARQLNSKLLHVYWLLILGLLFGDVVIGVVWMLRFEKMRADLKPILRLRLQVEYNRVPQFSEQWDQLQREFSCCGVTGPPDFDNQWPQSCCSTENSINSSLEDSLISSNTLKNNVSNLALLRPCLDPYTQGCDNQLTIWLKKTADLLFILGFCVIAFMKLCFLGILRFEIREMIQKIQMMKEPLSSNVPPPQISYPQLRNHQLLQQHKQPNEIAVNYESIKKKKLIPVVTTNMSLGTSTLLAHTEDISNTKHPLLVNNTQEGGVDSDTNSHCALILEESTLPSQHHSIVSGSNRRNTNNYELHELRRQLPSLTDDNYFATALLKNSSSVIKHKMPVVPVPSYT